MYDVPFEYLQFTKSKTFSTIHTLCAPNQTTESHENEDDEKEEEEEKALVYLFQDLFYFKFDVFS